MRLLPIFVVQAIVPEEGEVVVVKAEPANPAKLRVLGRIPNSRKPVPP
jgi:hypothetical protein